MGERWIVHPSTAGLEPSVPRVNTGSARDSTLRRGASRCTAMVTSSTIIPRASPSRFFVTLLSLLAWVTLAHAHEPGLSTLHAVEPEDGVEIVIHFAHGDLAYL